MDAASGHRQRARHIRSALSLAFWVSGACGEPIEPTQTIVFVEAVPEVRRATDMLRMRAGRPGRATDFDRHVKPQKWPIKLVFTPGEPDPDLTFRLEVEARDAAGESLTFGYLETGFVRNQPRFVRLTLLPNCSGATKVITRDASELGRSAGMATRLSSCDPLPVGPTRDPAPANDAGSDAEMLEPTDGEPPPEAEPPPTPMHPSAAGAAPSPVATLDPCAAGSCDEPHRLVTIDRGATLANVVASGADGSAFVAWVGAEGLWAERFREGQGFGGPRAYEHESASWDDLRIVADGVGGALLAWRERRDDGPSVWITRFDGEAWMPRARADDPALGAPAGLELFGGRGDALALAVPAQQNGELRVYTRYATTTSSIVWSDPVAWELEPALGLDALAFAFDAAGRALFAWHAALDASSRTTGVYASFALRGGAVFTAARPDGTDSAHGRDPAVWITRSGEPVIVWYDHTAEPTVVANRASAAGDWDTPRRLDEPEQSIDPANSRLAFAPDGRALVVWTDAAQGGVRASLFMPGAGFGASERIDAGGSGRVEELEVASDADGNFVAAWTARVETKTEVRANRYRSDGGWSDPVTLEHSDEDEVHTLRIAAAEPARAMVTWIRSERGSGRSSLWARPLESAH